MGASGILHGSRNCLHMGFFIYPFLIVSLTLPDILTVFWEWSCSLNQRSHPHIQNSSREVFGNPFRSVKGGAAIGCDVAVSFLVMGGCRV